MHFAWFAGRISKAAGHPAAFMVAVGVVLVWAALGPLYGWSDSHSLFINTLTTVVTFGLGFLILHAQNRDTLALHAKIDALIKVSEASNRFIGLETLTEDEIRREREHVVECQDEHGPGGIPGDDGKP